jgi:Ca2+-binding RTX toxin-like protein
MSVQPLDDRVLPAVTATFFAATGVLTVTGDDQDNSLAVSRDAAGTLVVNGDGVIVPVQGGPATAANTTLIRIFGMGGNDELIWSRSANLPPAIIDGGTGDDFITSGSGNDTLIGGPGNDTFRLDTDAALGSDTIDESGGGIDTLDFSSTTTRTVSINLGNPAAQVINAGLTLTLSAGNTIENVIGGALGDTLTGNGLNNVIQGSGGNDLVTGSAGNDTFQWNPGDGNDIVDGITGDGLSGSDRLVVNGSDDAEKFNISAVGNGARVTRDVDNVILDLVGVESVDVNAMGGADTITVGDLSATAVTAVNLDVGPAGDGAADAVIVNGTAGNDQIDVSIAGLRVIGLHAPVSLTNLAASDSLTINGGGGDDDINAASIPAGTFKLTENGEAGNDTLTGSRGNDTLIGGDGDDFFLGFRGNDTAFMDDGNDTFEWDQGDGSDTVEGQGGRDTLLFNGSNDAENFDFSANSNHVRFLRTVANAANVTMDLSGVEELDLNARSGADAIVVNDLSATDLTVLNIDLDSAAGNGTGDGATDSVIVNGTAGDDAVQIAAFGTRIAIGGLFPFVNIAGSDGTNDHLTVNTLGGNDVVDAANLPANLIGLTVNLGDGQAAPRVASVVANGGAAQRSRVTDLTVIFSSQVSLATTPGAAFTLTRNSDGVAVNFTATVTVVNGVTVVTLSNFGGSATQFGSLADGSYTLTTLANQVSTGGVALDGNGDGIGGDNNTQGIFRLLGDINGDRRVDVADFGALSSSFGSHFGQSVFIAAFDFNNDGVIDIADFGQFSIRFFTMLP